MHSHFGPQIPQNQRSISLISPPSDASPPCRIMKLWRRSRIGQWKHSWSFYDSKFGDLVTLANVNEAVRHFLIFTFIVDRVQRTMASTKIIDVNWTIHAIDWYFVHQHRLLSVCGAGFGFIFARFVLAPLNTHGWSNSKAPGGRLSEPKRFAPREMPYLI